MLVPLQSHRGQRGTRRGKKLGVSFSPSWVPFGKEPAEPQGREKPAASPDSETRAGSGTAGCQAPAWDTTVPLLESYCPWSNRSASSSGSTGPLPGFQTGNFMSHNTVTLQLSGTTGLVPEHHLARNWKCVLL